MGKKPHLKKGGGTLNSSIFSTILKCENKSDIFSGKMKKKKILSSLKFTYKNML